MSKRNLRGSRAIITGASSGIGWELALEFARRGASVESLHERTMITPLFLESFRRIVDMENELKARELYEDFRLYDRDALYYPPRDMIFYQADLSGNLLTKQRMQVFQALREREHVSVITCAGGCMDFLLPFRVFENNRLTITGGAHMDLQEISRRLARMGYERYGAVEASGQFAIRGDILDIYPLTEELPWRIEFWDDEVDSIRSFDPQTQRSVENLEEAVIFPATEEPGREEDETGFFRRLTDTLLDYLPASSLVILDEPSRILENAGALFREYSEAMKHRLEEKQITAAGAQRMITPEMFAAGLNRRCCAALSLMDHSEKRLDITEKHTILARSVGSYNNQFPMLVKDLKRLKRDRFRVILLSSSRTRAERLAKELQAEELNAFYSEDKDRLLQPGEILVTQGYAKHGFEYPMQKFVLITETDIFGAVQKKKRRKKSEHGGQQIRNFQELSVGDILPVFEAEPIQVHQSAYFAVEGPFGVFFHLE